MSEIEGEKKGGEWKDSLGVHSDSFLFNKILTNLGKGWDHYFGILQFLKPTKSVDYTKILRISMCILNNDEIRVQFSTYGWNAIGHCNWTRVLTMKMKLCINVALVRMQSRGNSALRESVGQRASEGRCFSFTPKRYSNWNSVNTVGRGSRRYSVQFNRQTLPYGLRWGG